MKLRSVGLMLCLSLVNLKLTAAGSCIRPPAFSEVSLRVVPRCLNVCGGILLPLPLRQTTAQLPPPLTLPEVRSQMFPARVPNIPYSTHPGPLVSDFFEDADKPTPSSRSSITHASPSGPKLDWQADPG
ncbi:hypothetical protein EDB87DRAFT_1579532 [Lactarius vividus]|nr:hypothetical protein EDB87DRAFT_1579532 [Lactarius vividus]